MSQELFQAVQNAEETADQIMQDAQHQARELLKAAESEIKAEERKAALAHRTQYQSILDDWRQATQKRIEKMHPQVLAEQREGLNVARTKLDQVSQMIFERIWNDGNR